MRNRIGVLAAWAVLAVGCAAPGTTAAPGGGSWPRDEAALREALETSMEAWNQGDLRGHLAIYADSVTMMTGAGPRVGVDPIEQAFLAAYWEDGLPRQALRFEQVRIRPVGEDAALATGRFVLSGGGLAEQSGWFTLVWERTPAGWRAVHDHSS